MKRYGLYRTFPATMTDDEMKKAIPNMAKALLAELFDACDKDALKPNLETLAIIYKHAGPFDGPFGMVSPVYGSDEPIRATLAAKVEADEIGS